MNRYQVYKETEFEWLGKIPSNWKLQRVGKFFNERSEKVDDVNYPPLSVTMSGIVDQLSDVAKTDDGENRKLVKKNDFVINSRSDRKGSSGIAPKDGSVSLINTVLKPNGLNPNFSEYLFKSYYFKEEYFRNGRGIHWDLWTTKWDQFRNINIPIPPSEEQKLISRYLEKKTEQIDNLVEKIQTKIDLLKEKRTSLINQCVTKGLDTNIEMKDSGVDCIGEIPKNWEVWSVRHLIAVSELEIQDGNHGEIHPKSDDYTDEGIPFIMASNLIDGQLDTKSANKLKKHQTDKLRIGFSYEGDVLLSHKGSIGKVALVESIDTPYIMLTPQVTYYRSKQKIIQRIFLLLTFQSLGFLEQMTILSSDGSTRKYCGILDQKNLKIPIPPLTEQFEISSFISPKLEKIETFIRLENKYIKLLKEYRQSLISSAVNGKFRVTKDMI